jgi:hypothetical protein
MKRDLRRQTFSKPGKPDDEEIKKLTSDDTDNQPTSPPSPIREKIVSESREKSSSTKKNGSSAEVKSRKATAAPPNGEKTNPFLLLRGQTSEIGIEKTGYRLRSDYMDLLKLVKRMKKGYTLEAVLDDALTYYFENSEDGRKAAKQRQMLDSDQ